MTKYQKWTEEDINIIKEKYGQISLNELSELINHPVGSIHQKAFKLRLKFTPPRWKDETTRRCSVCKEYKHVSKFNNHKNSKDGFDKTCKECHAKFHSEYSRELKEIVFQAYGGYICQCCGLEAATDKEKFFFQLDHVNNDGYIFRKKNFHHFGLTLYKWLINNNFPNNIQVLCANCNFGKKLNNGVCPHKG